MKFSTILKNCFRQKMITDKDIGIEIEVEGRDLPNIKSKFWESVGDGSLRNGIEYRSYGPQYLQDLPMILEEIHNYLKESKLDFSFRTSTHIHMNMTQETVGTIQTVAYLYLLFEDAFLRYAGESRTGNRFCLGFKDAEGVVNDVLTMLNDENIMNIEGDHSRYASMNIAALSEHGTLEFRALRGTIDNKIITPWIDSLFRLRSIARTLHSPSRAYNMLMDQGVEKFSKYIFKGYYDLFYYPEMFMNVEYNTSCLIQLPFSLLEKEEKEKKVEVKLPKAPNPPIVIIDDIPQEIMQQDVGAAVARGRQAMRDNDIRRFEMFADVPPPNPRRVFEPLFIHDELQVINGANPIHMNVGDMAAAMDEQFALGDVNEVA